MIKESDNPYIKELLEASGILDRLIQDCMNDITFDCNILQQVQEIVEKVRLENDS